jgi:hypothetical protein
MAATIEAPPVVSLTTVDGETQEVQLRADGSWQCPFCKRYNYPEGHRAHSHSGEWDQPCGDRWCIAGGAHTEEATRRWRERDAKHKRAAAYAKAEAAYCAEVRAEIPAQAQLDGFAWYCLRKDEGGIAGAGNVLMCSGRGSDKDEFTAHMRIHGHMPLRAEVPKIKLRRKPPAATLRKLKADPLQWIEWTDCTAPEVCECLHMREDHGGPESGCPQCDCPLAVWQVQQSARRRGQFLAEANPSEIWVIPDALAPWETGTIKTVRVNVHSIKQGEAIQAALDGTEAANDEHPAGPGQVPVLGRDSTDLREPEPQRDGGEHDRLRPQSRPGDAGVRSVGSESTGDSAGRDGGIPDRGRPVGAYERDTDGSSVAAETHRDGDKPMSIASYAAREAVQAAFEANKAKLRQQAAQGTAQVAVRDTADVERQRATAASCHPGDGLKALDLLSRFHQRADYWEAPEYADLLAAWELQALATEDDGSPIWRALPRLIVAGPYGCGKSLTLDQIAMATGSRVLVRCTYPGIRDMIGKHRKVVILDDAQMTFGAGRKSEDVRMVINAHTKGRAIADGISGEVDVTGQVAMGGLARMLTGKVSVQIEDTLSRCFVLWKARKPKGYHVPEVTDAGEAKVRDEIVPAMREWCATYRQMLKTRAAWFGEGNPTGLPDLGGGGRGNDQLARPLLSVCDVATVLGAGHVREDSPEDTSWDWSERIRKALVFVSGVPEPVQDEESPLDGVAAAFDQMFAAGGPTVNGEDDSDD